MFFLESRKYRYMLLLNVQIKCIVIEFWYIALLKTAVGKEKYEAKKTLKRYLLTFVTRFYK